MVKKWKLFFNTYRVYNKIISTVKMDESFKVMLVIADFWDVDGEKYH